MSDPSRTTAPEAISRPLRLFAAALIGLAALTALPALLAGSPAAVAAAPAGEGAAAAPEALPRDVFARVNGKDIPKEQFLGELYQVLGESYKDTFVTHVLVDQKTKDLGIDVTSAEIDTRVQESVDRVLKDNFSGDAQRMNDALKDRGLTLDGWKRRLRTDARYDLLLEKLIRKDRTVSDETLRHMFEEKYGTGGVQLKVRHIMKNVMVASSQDYTLQQYEQDKAKIEEESAARAQEALSKLGAGQSFEAVMMAYSDDPRRMQGGTMTSWKGRFGADLDEAAGKLQKGQHSGVIKCPDGLRIIECTDVIQSDEVHALHILIAVGARGKGRTDADAKKKADELLAKIKAGADFGALAKENSDDPGSAARGGDLGWFGRRVMVKEFEAVAFTMAAGGITPEPVKTNFGYHIIKVLEKRTAEEKTIRQILVGTQFAAVKDRKLRPALEAKARESLEALKTQSMQPGGSFAELAKANSDDGASKGDGGLIQNYREGLYGGAFDEAVRSLKPGDPPRIVLDSAGNLHLVAVDEIIRTDFDKVRESLKNEELARPATPQEKSEYVAKLRETATIVFQDR
jgi:parvulin-like peptidyl-prolyl isomerase